MAIRVNHENVLRRATELRALADAHRRDSDRADQQRIELGARWTDQAGHSWANVAAKLGRQMRETAAKLDRLAEELTGAAEMLKEREESGRRAARTLEN